MGITYVSPGRPSSFGPSVGDQVSREPNGTGLAEAPKMTCRNESASAGFKLTSLSETRVGTPVPRLTVRVLPSISYVPEAVMFIPASCPKITQVSRSIARAMVMLLNQPGMVSREDLRKVLWPSQPVNQSDSPPRRFRSLYKTTTPVAVRALSEGQDESGAVSIRRGDRMTERLAVKTDALGPTPCRKSMGAASGVAPGRIALISRPVLPSGFPTGFCRWFAVEIAAV